MYAVGTVRNDAIRKCRAKHSQRQQLLQHCTALRPLLPTYVYHAYTVLQEAPLSQKETRDAVT